MARTLTPMRNMSIAEMQYMASRSFTGAPSMSQLKSHLVKSHFQQQQPPSVASPNLTSLVTQYQHVRGYRQNNSSPKGVGMSLRDHLMASNRPKASTSAAPTSSRQQKVHSVH